MQDKLYNGIVNVNVFYRLFTSNGRRCVLNMQSLMEYSLVIFPFLLYIGYAATFFIPFKKYLDFQRQ